MYHSIIISGKNTYDEWGLVPMSRPVVNPPTVKTTYVDPRLYVLTSAGNSLWSERRLLGVLCEGGQELGKCLLNSDELSPW